MIEEIKNVLKMCDFEQIDEISNFTDDQWYRFRKDNTDIEIKIIVHRDNS